MKTKRKRPLAMNELAEYLAIKFEDQLATLSPDEQIKRREALHQMAVAARAKGRQAARTRQNRSRRG
jgi:hypothetical protein